MNRFLPLLILVSILFCLLPACMEQAPAATEPAHTVAPTEPPATEAPTEPPTEAPTEPPVIPQPEALTALLPDTGYEDLAALGCTQLITVEATGNAAEIQLYACTDGRWQSLPEMRCSGHVGKNGVLSPKREGDGGTPAGLYAVGSAFYIHEPPVTALPSFRITDDTYWVDDPDSRYYNQRVEGTAQKDWDSAEHMIDYSVYRYGFVVDYNTACEPGAGSAIFFHIGKGATAGCISTAEDMVLAYLAALDPTRHPHILITGS